ncbi:hypothetical protein ADEAN_000778100 [Angomonas deanei]|uniref:Uncharacterized protein n=1 Tax=Angomonas deanei TaxID=59799 RepID=A0A7G2CKD6_9TRYP|nr:hypothetical protein ADEAN_000778100 [Angomonas deanei]
MHSSVPVCSWEEKYDFTPKISYYPGAKGVVREKWWTPTKRSASKPKDTQPSTGAKVTTTAVTEATRVKPTKPKPKDTATTIAPRKPQAPSQVTRSRPARSACTPQTPLDADRSASTVQTYTQAREAAVRGRRFQRNYKAPPTAEQMEAFEAMERERQRRVEAYAGTAPVPPTSRKVVKPHVPYKPRVKEHFTLPPSFASQLRSVAQCLHPSVVLAGTTASHPRPTTPPPTGSVWLNGQYKLQSRQGFLSSLTKTNPGVMADQLGAKYAVEANSAAYDYNFVTPDVLEEAWRQRLATLYKQQDALYEHFVGGFAPISEAVATCKQSSNGAEGKMFIVRDDGHICSPIELHSIQQNPSDGVYYDDMREDEVAVLVKPFLDELPSVADRTYNERERVISKGREWDRQYAIRAAVGTTAQETLLDLDVDPRYRHPGERLLRRNGALLR